MKVILELDDGTIRTLEGVGGMVLACNLVEDGTGTQFVYLPSDPVTYRCLMASIQHHAAAAEPKDKA